MKIAKVILFTILSLSCLGIIILFECNDLPAGSSIAGIAIAYTLQALERSVQDLFDTTNWKVSQRKLKRGGFISDKTIVRISFAYLFRIKIGDKYLLVKNERGTGKYQPVGGVYQFKRGEQNELRNKYQVKDDNKIPIDESSRNDYRLRLENKYLRKFVRHFDQKARRENVNNLAREFREELVETGILNWQKITYRFCGRHMTELHFGEHFQMYELLLADVVELLPTAEQEKDLTQLMEQYSELFRFATADEITTLGVTPATKNLAETIADHSKKILQEKEGELLSLPCVGQKYTVSLK